MPPAPMQETLLLKQPTISADEIVFLYAGDLWIANLDGSHARRLTAQKGRKAAPLFSPDGSQIAFSANYDGNLSVYVIPRAGGSPRRLTFHPYEDWVRGWTPDGQQVLFTSARDSFSFRARRLFTVGLDGGLPTTLPMPMGDRGAYAPDGKSLAYTAYAEAFWSWKRYRGGQTVPIWVLDLASYDYVQVPHENASDSFPCWVGDTLYFLSDRAGTMNVFRWQRAAGQVQQVTHHTDFDVRSLTSGAGRLAYEQAGRLHLIDPAAGEALTTLSIAISADLPYTRPTYQKEQRHIENAGISPTGQRAIFEVRGDILTFPAKKGELRNLTRTSGAAERYPAWSPDGQSIAYFSDASGEYQLVITDQKGQQKDVITPGRPSFFYSPVWSPDGKKIAFTDKGLNLYFVTLDSKAVTRVDSDTYDHPERSLNPAWSPDSQWLTYTKRLDNHIRAVFLFSLVTGNASQVTDGMSDTTGACFSRDGKYLFFAASSNYGLNTGWLDMSSYERPVRRSLYVAVLNCEDPSPLLPESDEEKMNGADESSKNGDEGDEPDDRDSDDQESGDQDSDDQGSGDQASAVQEPGDQGLGGENHTAEKDEQPKPGDKPPTPKAPPVVKIDLEGLDQRILALPLPERGYCCLQTAENRLFYLEYVPNQWLESEVPAFLLHCYDLKERKSEVFVDKVQDFWVSANGKKLMYRADGRPRFAIVGVDKKPHGDDGTLNLNGLELAVDPRAEWQQMFREGYRIHRDFFYDPHLHGLDLEAAYQKYLPFLAHVGHRDDLNYLLAEFSGELVSGHAYVSGGDIPSADWVGVGLLGADVELTEDGYYRIKHIYPGQNWHPEMRSPLTEPGVNVREGELILAVNGRALRSPANFYQAFEKTAERITDVLVGPSPDETQARTVMVRPIGSDLPLRHWNWVEGNRKKVSELSNGRVAYVYLPDTAGAGYSNFNRYYFAQLDKQAVVLDERFNGGGSVADYIIDLIDRPLLSYWATREGKPFTTPNASIFGPRVMIINELAGSGGDALPLYFRRRGLGKLVGKRTWGGLIGIYDYPPLIDGGFFTSPRMAIYSPDGQWEVENEGVAPDIEIEMTPKEVIAGRDPQLEAAVAVVLAELEAAPFTRAPRPAPADRV